MGLLWNRHSPPAWPRLLCRLLSGAYLSQRWEGRGLGGCGIWDVFIPPGLPALSTFLRHSVVLEQR